MGVYRYLVYLNLKKVFSYLIKLVVLIVFTNNLNFRIL